eukprot:3111741-Amphidinium_carterae.1
MKLDSLKAKPSTQQEHQPNEPQAQMLFLDFLDFRYLWLVQRHCLIKAYVSQPVPNSKRERV